MLPIWVGVFEANAIALQVENVQTPRPMTHDLLRSVIDELGAQVERIVVCELKENTFYALLHVRSAEGEHSIDARPSDAIALALAHGSRIFVEDSVIQNARSVEMSRRGRRRRPAAEVAREPLRRRPRQVQDVGGAAGAGRARGVARTGCSCAHIWGRSHRGPPFVLDALRGLLVTCAHRRAPRPLPREQPGDHHRYRKSEGWRREDDDGHQPCRRPVHARSDRAPRRPRSPGELVDVVPRRAFAGQVHVRRAGRRGVAQRRRPAVASCRASTSLPHGSAGEARGAARGRAGLPTSA